MSSRKPSGGRDDAGVYDVRIILHDGEVIDRAGLTEDAARAYAELPRTSNGHVAVVRVDRTG